MTIYNEYYFRTTQISHQKNRYKSPYKKKQLLRGSGLSLCERVCNTLQVLQWVAVYCSDWQSFTLWIFPKKKKKGHTDVVYYHFMYKTHEVGIYIVCIYIYSCPTYRFLKNNKSQSEYHFALLQTATLQHTLQHTHCNTLQRTSLQKKKPKRISLCAASLCVLGMRC